METPEPRTGEREDNRGIINDRPVQGPFALPALCYRPSVAPIRGVLREREVVTICPSVVLI